MAANHRVSKPVELNTDREFDHAVKFAMERRYAALMPVIRATSPGVIVVSDDPTQWDNVLEQAGADLLGRYPGTYAAYARDALRPASRGAGRGRFR
jgi:hypothetical protein